MSRVRFDPESHPPLDLSDGTELSRALNVLNSPLLFGCRSGLCGTCLIEVLDGVLPEPDSDEREALEVYAEGNPRARLACQIRVSGDLTLRKIDAQ